MHGGQWSEAGGWLVKKYISYKSTQASNIFLLIRLLALPCLVLNTHYNVQHKLAQMLLLDAGWGMGNDSLWM